MRTRHEPEVPWGSFADALSGMLFVFVLTTFWFAWQLAQAKAAAEQEKAELEEKTRQILEADEQAMELTRLRGRLTTCLGEDATLLDPRPQSGEPRISLYLRGAEWFEPGDASLRTAQQQGAVDQIRHCVSALLDDPALRGRYRIRVYLEGHTDSVPVRGRDSNWELSGRRAAVVVRRVLGAAEPSADGEEANVEPDERIAAALAEDDLEVMAVGMADLQPAWSRLCEEAALDGPDRTVCAALHGWSAGRGGPDAEAVEQALLAALADPAVQGFDHLCQPSHGEVELGRPELLRQWANRCPDPAADRGERRRGLLRRVDLRLELLPRIADEVASAGSSG